MSLLERKTIELARLWPSMLLALVAAAVGVKFAFSNMVAPLWLPPIANQIAVYVLCWILLCLFTRFLAWRLSFYFPVTIVAISVVSVFVLAGISATTIVAVVFFDAFLIGAFIQRPTPDKIIAPILVSIGLAVMALLSGTAELFRISRPFIFTLATLAFLLLLLDPCVRKTAMTWLRAQLAGVPRKERGRDDWLIDIAVVMLIGIFGLHLLFVLQPERYYDALAVHLYVPSYVLAHGRWNFDVGSWAFAHMPLTVDFLYTWFYALGGEDAVRLYNFGALVLIASIIVGWLRRTTSSVVSLFTVLMFVSTPLAFIETTSLFIENTLTLWITAAAMIAITRWRETDLASSRSVLVLLAAAAASKLHGILALAIIGSVLLTGFVRSRPGWRDCLLFLVVATVCGALAAVPYLYSWADTGNPVFPFFNQVFKSPMWPPEAFVDTRWIGHFDWKLLWNATFQSSRFIEGSDGVLGLSLLIFLPLACLMSLASGDVLKQLPVIVGLGLVILVASQIQYLRYFYIAIPILFIAIGGFVDIASRCSVGRATTLSVASLCIAIGVFLVPSAGWIFAVSDFRADFNREARRQLVQDQVPERLANTVINEIAGKDARVYYTGSPFPALLEGTGLSSVWYNTRYAAALQSTTTKEGIQDLLNKMGIGYVVVTPGPPSPLMTATKDFLQTSGQIRAKIGNLEIYQIN